MAKRFYEKVAVKPQNRAYVVTLDGRVLKTPGKKSLVLESKAHAQHVAQEWRAQGTEILPETMPCTRLLNVACELTPGRRPELVDEFVNYTANDLLCFRTPSPADLTARQQEYWQPVLDWAADKYGLALAVTPQIKPPKQPAASLEAARKIANGLSDKDLTLLVHFTASFGSALLALTVMNGHKDVSSAYELSRLEEMYQNQRWGADEEAQARAEGLLDELSALGRLFG